MPKTVLYMSMSLDGFITGPNDGLENGLGTGGMRLHDWLGTHREQGVAGYRPDGPSGEVFDELMATGAVITGRRTFDIAGGWGGDHHDGVPIFVPTHRAPDDAQSAWPSVSFVTDGIESAVTQAKRAAGDKDVMVHGAQTAQEMLRAGVLDEMEIHLIPVLLGVGRPLFDTLGTGHIELELARIIDAPGVTHLRYRVGSSIKV
jgi:dihydrofolate reductase